MEYGGYGIVQIFLLTFNYNFLLFSFIVIIAVALLIVAGIIIYCLVKKNKEADQHYCILKTLFIFFLTN